MKLLDNDLHQQPCLLEGHLFLRLGMIDTSSSIEGFTLRSNVTGDFAMALVLNSLGSFIFLERCQNIIDRCSDFRNVIFFPNSGHEIKSNIFNYMRMIFRTILAMSFTYKQSICENDTRMHKLKFIA